MQKTVSNGVCETTAEFLKEMKHVYNEIDKYSSTMWGIMDEHQLHRGRKTRNDIQEQHKDESKQWKEETNAQLGYGEIRPVSRIDLTLTRPHIYNLIGITHEPTVNISKCRKNDPKR